MTRKYVLPALAIVCAAVFVLQPVGVFAQSSQGGLRGAVKDSQGEPHAGSGRQLGSLDGGRSGSRQQFPR
jgi:hypothetical protein